MLVTILLLQALGGIPISIWCADFNQGQIQMWSGKSKDMNYNTRSENKIIEQARELGGRRLRLEKKGGNEMEEEIEKMQN